MPGPSRSPELMTETPRGGFLRVFVASWLPFLLASALPGCASAPPAPLKPPGPSPQEKMALILRLEDERMLRDPPPPVAPPAPPQRGKKAPPVVAPPPR